MCRRTYLKALVNHEHGKPCGAEPIVEEPLEEDSGIIFVVFDLDNSAGWTGMAFILQISSTLFVTVLL